MSLRRARWLWPVLALSALLLLSACAEEAESPDAADTADVDQEAADPDAAVGARLEVTDSDLGTHLVDGEGMVVYLFTPDEAGESTCYDDCAESWPPVLAEDPAVGEGVDEELVGTTTREDGEVQVTYDGWPLYHFAGDEQPGDANGQGVNDVWFVIGADGAMIDAEADDEADDDDRGVGY